MANAGRCSKSGVLGACGCMRFVASRTVVHELAAVRVTDLLVATSLAMLDGGGKLQPAAAGFTLF